MSAEVRERVLELVGTGMPLAAVCRVEGMPSRQTVYDWRRRDPEFGRQFEVVAEFGRVLLVEAVSEEYQQIMHDHPPKIARRWWNARHRDLVRVNSKFFGGPY
ncbi:hypothetical protein [Rhodopila sp.]|uniref:terminase small subunit-like protein n=1 Tax=Rhodopila sp. TaxID=2480087 RepID=UPI003D0E0C63